MKLTCEKSISLLHTNDKDTDKQTRKTILLANTQKYLGVNLTKEVKGLHDGKCKMLKIN